MPFIGKTKEAAVPYLGNTKEAVMPSDYYLLVSGVNGESQAQGMTNYIDILSWSWGGSNPTIISAASMGLSAGKPVLSDFTCTFMVDASVYQLVANMVRGTHIQNCTFVGRKTGGDGTPYKYFIITLTNCFIDNFGTSGDSTGVPQASLSIAYGSIQLQYFTQDTSTGGVTLAGQANYDVQQAKAA